MKKDVFYFTIRHSLLEIRYFATVQIYFGQE